ncbi:MAG: YdeI/OmpD-associated family protein [Bacteroidota bacterium]
MSDETFSYKSEIFLLEKLKLNYVEVPYEILVQTKSETDKTIYNQRFIIKVNDSEEWQAGVVSLGNKKGYITVKTAILKKNHLRLGDEVSVTLEKDDSEFGMIVSEELQEVLNQDFEGKQRFDLLPLGKKRYIIYYVNQVKSSDKRIERAVMLITNLKKTAIGKEEFRILLGKE